MAVADWSTTASLNTTLGGITLDGSVMIPSQVDDAFREMMAQLKTYFGAFPTSSTDNTLPRFNGTSGAFQTSGVTVDDSNNVSGIANLTTTGTFTLGGGGTVNGDLNIVDTDGASQILLKSSTATLGSLFSTTSITQLDHRSGATTRYLRLNAVADTGTCDVATFTLSGVFRAGDGTASAPGLAFGANTNSGIFNTSGKVSVSSNGAEQVRFSSTDAWRCQNINNSTTASAANIFISSTTGDVQRSTSSERYKTDIRDYERGLADALLLRPVRFKGINDGNTEYAGLIAEEVHAAGLTEFVVYDDQGRPDALHYPLFVALLLNTVRDLNARLEAIGA